MSKNKAKAKSKYELTKEQQQIVNMCIVGGVSPTEFREALDAKIILDGQRRAESQRVAKERTILEKAQDIVYGDRESSYGPPRKNWEDIAGLWNAYFDSIKMRDGVLWATIPGDAKEENSFKITAQDAAQMMILLKVARLATNPSHEDSLLDLAGYVAVTERVRKNK